MHTTYHTSIAVMCRLENQSLDFVDFAHLRQNDANPNKGRMFRNGIGSKRKYDGQDSLTGGGAESENTSNVSNTTEMSENHSTCCILYKARAYKVPLSTGDASTTDSPQGLCIELVGNRFLRRMVRILVVRETVIIEQLCNY